MRFDKEAVFITKEGIGQYNPDSGEYEDSAEETVKKMCHVHDLKAERLVHIFGRADLRALEFVHRGALVQASKILFGGKEFAITSNRQVRGKASYIASEVMP